MKEKESTNSNLGIKICIAIIVLAIIAVLGFGFYYNNKIDLAKKNEAKNQENNLNTEKVSETKEDKNIKTDDIEALVYDANYSYKNFSNESYYSQSMDTTYSLKDINLPYINIGSEDADKANKEIKALFEELAAAFEEQYENEKIWYNIASYETYTNGNLLSILITVESGGTDVEHYEYYTYNFNLETLNLCNYEEIYKLAGLNSNNIDEKAKEAIKEYKGFTNFEEEATTYISKSIENYTNSVKDKTIKYFIDENNELNVIVKIELPVGGGEFNTILKVK